MIRVSREQDSSANDIAAIIMKDPALTAKILRVVNSPFYGQIRKITTVNQAVVTLGMRTVTAVALSASIYDKMNKVDSSIDRKRFWRHSLEVAIGARMIAEAVRYEPILSLKITPENTRTIDNNPIATTSSMSVKARRS